MGNYYQVYKVLFAQTAVSKNYKVPFAPTNGKERTEPMGNAQPMTKSIPYNSLLL